MKLKVALPIDDLLPYLFVADTVPANLKEKLDSIHVHSEKVKCLLDAMERGLKAGISDQFESFICVMEKFGEENSDIVSKKLAEDIRLILSEREPAARNSWSLQRLATPPGRCTVYIYKFVVTGEDQTMLRGGACHAIDGPPKIGPLGPSVAIFIATGGLPDQVWLP